MRNRLLLVAVIQLTACKGTSPEDPPMDAGPDAGDSPPQVAPCEVLGLPGPPSFDFPEGTARLWDIDGDGKLDLVEVRDSVVSVSPGNGNGAFGPSIDSPLSSTNTLVFSINIADLDRDGKLDLVLTSGLPPAEAANILLGDGTGRFHARADYPTRVVADAAVADFNGDGKLDLALAGRDTDTVNVRLGHGDGTFGAQTTYPVGKFTIAAAVADINGDHNLDLVMINEDVDPVVSVLPGNGDGTFQARVDRAVHPGASRLATTDLNGDGWVDLVVVFVDKVGVFINDGTGELGDEVEYAIASPAAGFGLAIGDITRDGKLDVVVYGGARVTIFAGNGDGTLRPGVATPARPAPGRTAVALSDVTGDGALDVLLMTGSAVSVLNNDGEGGLISAAMTNSGLRTTAVAAADLNGDGDVDFILTGQDSIAVVLGGSEGGAFQPLVGYPVTGAFERAVVADVSGDGRADLLVRSQAGVSVLLGNGDGTFHDAVESAVEPPSPFRRVVFAVGDLSGDGKPDLVISEGAELAMYVGNGDGTFRSRVEIADIGYGSAIGALALGDLDEDGQLDAVISYSQACAECGPQPSGTDLLLNRGGALQTSAHLTPATRSIVLGDFNGDGKLDLATAGVGITVRRGNGDGTVQAPATYGSESSGIVQLADITGDGKLDIVQYLRPFTTNDGINVLSILPGNGDGTFAAAVTYPYLIGDLGAVADVDHDGRLDVITPGDTFGVLFARCVR